MFDGVDAKTDLKETMKDAAHVGIHAHICVREENKQPNKIKCVCCGSFYSNQQE